MGDVGANKLSQTAAVETRIVATMNLPAHDRADRRLDPRQERLLGGGSSHRDEPHARAGLRHHAVSHPVEHPLELPYASLLELNSALQAMDPQPRLEVHADFIIYPLP